MSKQAPRGVLTSPLFNAPHQPIYPEFDADAAVRRGYARNIYAYRCINAIANNISALPFRAGSQLHGTPVPGATLARLLGPPPGTPNAVWSPDELWRYCIAQYLIMGKFALVKEFDQAGRVVGLWPISAQWVTPILPDVSSTKPSYFEGYRYGVQGSPGYREYTPDELVYCWRKSQVDPRQPESPINIGSLDLNIYTLLGQFDYAFLNNGAVPSHLIVTESFSEDTERQGFRDQFLNRFGGAMNSGRPMFAERDIDDGEVRGSLDPVQVVKVGQSQKDSELSVLRDSKIADICVLLGVPLSILADSRTAKYENVRADRETFWRETCRPLFHDLEGHINTSLAPALGPYVGWFDANGIPELRSEPIFTDKYAPLLVQYGIITKDEMRAEFGLPPLPKDEGNVVTPPIDVPVASSHAPGTPKIDAVIPADVKAPQRALELPIEQAARSTLEARTMVRELLSLISEDITRAIEQRSTSRRKNRPVFDSSYWQARITRVMQPALRMTGLSSDAITLFSNDITAHVAERLALGDGLLGMAEYGVSQLESYLAHVPFSHVEAALVGLATGEFSSDHALTLIQGGGNGGAA